MSQPPGIVWLRHDLRLADQPALSAACARGRPLIVLYIHEPQLPWPRGAASRYWLHQSLAALDAALRRRGQRLVLRVGTALAELERLLAETGSDAVYVNRDLEPAAAARDTAIEHALRGRVTWHGFEGRTLFKPGAIVTGGGSPYRVFTPFYRACLQAGIDTRTLPVPRLPAAPAVASLELSELALEPRIDWAEGIRARWRFGERAASARLDQFLDGPVERYADLRDAPGCDATSSLSPHLHFGEVSARTCWAATESRPGSAALDAWRRQLVWREFGLHLLWHFPHTVEAPFQPRFAAFPWEHDDVVVHAWQRGRTGIPLVDAGMRELWTSGTMHNRVRMVVASFLCKHLGQHWLTGARWFWDTLVDADLANNTLGWQWTAGCGADAAPYFRVFNPLGQSRRFDPDGIYLRHWLPERAHLLGDAIHDPAIPVPGYPAPLVDLAAGRAAALERYASLPR